MAELHSDKDQNIKSQLIEFFVELKKQGLIGGVVSDLGEQLARLVVHHGYSPRKGQTINAKSFRHFDVRKTENCTSSLKLCRVVVTVLPMVRFESEQGLRIAPIYKRRFNREFENSGAVSGFNLFRRAEETSLGSRAKLDGDYIMFRMEHRLDVDRVPILKVSRNFLRFFPHSQSGLRFMMLSMAAAEGFLGGKGWVDDLHERYLCTGQIIDRSGPVLADEQVYGGMTTIVVEVNNRSPFVICKSDQRRGYLVEAAPLLHLRAVHHQEPSVSRGYLVRCQGTSQFGGTSNQSPEDRYLAIKQLQQRIKDRFIREPDPTEAADMLHKATGLNARDFYDDPGTSDGPRGLLVNLPFSGISDAPSDRSWPLCLPSLNGSVPSWTKDRRRPRQPRQKFGVTLNLNQG